MIRKIILLSILMVGLLSFSGAWATTYYINWVAGNDTNDGLTKATPWKRAPGMYGCSDNCLAYQNAHNSPMKTSGAGDSFILKGGVTWPKAALSWDWIYGSGTEENPIYFGVDQTWYTGASWTRPILDAEDDRPNFNVYSYAMFRAYGDGYVIDNIEFDGLRQINNDTPITPCMLSVGTSVPSTAGIEVKNCYFHGWSHGGTATHDNMFVLYSVLWSRPDDPDLNLIIHDNVFDGSDTTKDMAGVYKGSAGHFYNNYVGYVQNGIVGGNLGYIWGNTFEEIGTTDDFDPTQHHQSFEENGGQTIFYNNLIKNSSGGGTVLTYGIDGKKEYIFNNVIINVDHQVLQLGTKNGSSISLHTGVGYEMHVFNNTLQTLTQSRAAQVNGPTLTDAALMPLMSVKNNLLIGVTHAINFGAGVEVAGKIESNNIGITNTEATSAEYTESGTYPYYPPADGVTVGAGTDLRALAASIPSTTISDAATAALSGTSLGVKYDAVNHRVIGPNITPKLRGTIWDIGAYQSLLPPQNLRIIP